MGSGINGNDSAITKPQLTTTKTASLMGSGINGNIGNGNCAEQVFVDRFPYGKWN